MDIEEFKQQTHQCLTSNILPYWMNKMVDHEHGGFYGRIDGKGVLHPEAEKGCVLNARILWSFAAAYRVLKDPECLDMANRAKRYLIDHFIDHEYGDAFWSLDAEGRPKDTKKQTYAFGFCIYGLSEMARATGDSEALNQAIKLFNDIESHAFDSKNNGYIEALTRDWQPIADMRLSDKDENGSRTMNSHLHILEPYTNLYRVWPDARLKDKIINLLHIFTEQFYNQETHHLDLFINDEWQGKRNIQSFGHDIEASWLMDEAADVLGDKNVMTYIEPYVRSIADAADDGLQPDGSMIYERWMNTATDATADNKVLKADTQRQWWVQCESVVGHVNLYRHFGDKQALDKAQRCWEYIKSHLLAPDSEWYWSADEQGQPNTTDDRTGFWKCPYHNTRMCLETITMLS